MSKRSARGRPVGYTLEEKARWTIFGTLSFGFGLLAFGVVTMFAIALVVIGG